MANRQRERKVLLQTLYEWDMRGYDNHAISSYLRYTAKTFNELEDQEYESLTQTLEEITKKRVVIDEIIQKAAPAWPLDKISMTDRNVLRIGLSELLFGDREEVPPKVAINEAIDLAKRFGGPKSGKFVNGVIGAVYREIGEPGKDEQGKVSMSEVAYEDMPIEQKGAAVIYSKDDHGIIRIGMVHDVFGYWTLSKGSIDSSETKEEGTIRKIKQETHWDIEIVAHLGENEYIAYPPDKGPTRKQVNYFLAQSEYTSPILGNDSGGLDDVRWFGLDEITDLTMYDDVSQMIAKSIHLITESSQEDEDTEKDAPEETEPSSLNEMTLVELKEQAKNQGLTGYSNLNKSDLIDRLKEKNDE